MQKVQPRAALFTSTALSSLSPTTLKLIYASDGAALTPPAVTALRFGLMASGATLLMRDGVDLDRDGVEEAGPSGGFWRAAVELGIYATAGAQLSAASLEQIGVVRGTILLSTINVLTPFLSTLIGTLEEQRVVSARIWTACALALVSTIIALLDGPITATANELSAGDVTMLGAALCYATQQVRLGSLVADYPAQRLAAARLQTQALLSLVFLPLANSDSVAEAMARRDDVMVMASRALGWASQLSASQAGLLCFSAIVAVIGLLLQYEGQRTVPAASAQPIYATSPLLSALWAALVLSEPITRNEVLGGLGMGCAALLAARDGQGKPP